MRKYLIGLGLVILISAFCIVIDVGNKIYDKEYLQQQKQIELMTESKIN